MIQVKGWVQGIIFGVMGLLFTSVQATSIVDLQMTISPSTVSQSSAPQLITLTLTNQNSTPLNLNSLVPQWPLGFSNISDHCTASVLAPAGMSTDHCTVTGFYQPSTPGTVTWSTQVAANGYLWKKSQKATLEITSVSSVMTDIATTIQGLPDYAKVSITMTSKDGKTIYGPHDQIAGTNKFFDTMKPGAYNILAAEYTDPNTGSIYQASLGNPYPINADNSEIPIIYSKTQGDLVAVTTNIIGLPSNALVNVSMNSANNKNTYGPQQQATGQSSFANMVPGVYTVSASDYADPTTGDIYEAELKNSYSIDSGHASVMIGYKNLGPATIPIMITIAGDITKESSVLSVPVTLNNLPGNSILADGKAHLWGYLAEGEYSVGPETAEGASVTYSLKGTSIFVIENTQSEINLEYDAAPVAIAVAVHATLQGLPADITTVSKIQLFNEDNTYQKINAAVSGFNFTQNVVLGTYNYTGDMATDNTGACYYPNPTLPITIDGSSDPQNITIEYSPCNTSNSQVYYHMYMPPGITAGTTESIPLSGVYSMFIISNYVAGAVEEHMLKEHNPGLKFNQDYLYGSLFGQVLQENSDMQHLADGIAEGNNINTSVAAGQLLAVGQGGPYQLNDYSKRLPDSDSTDGSLGMINFVAVQNQLRYTIADQDSGAQTQRTGPPALDNIYFGPLAAAYFHYNDYLRVETTAKNSWYVNAPSWATCIQNVQAGKVDFMDMILNAIYNAGDYSDITVQYIKMCADPDSASNQAKISDIDNYSLNDSNYISSLELPSWMAASTFIIYPRQIRFYLDELYNNTDRIALFGFNLNNSLSLNISDIRNVFVASMQKLSYVNSASVYVSYTALQAQQAFDSACTSLSISANDSIEMNQSVQRTKMYNLLDTSLTNLESATNSKLNATTEQNLWQQS